jgi:hypothetical protein
MPKVKLSFTEEEIQQLEKYSAIHYDVACVQAGVSGGTIVGIRNMDGHPFPLSFREVEVLCKIMEGSENRLLHDMLYDVLTELNDEYDRLNR